MLERIATTVMGRAWAFAAAGVAILVSFAIATAPRPHCRCGAARPERVAWAEPRTPCEPSASSTVDRELACAERMTTNPRRAYLALMRARSLDTDRAYASTIDAMLLRAAPRAVGAFAVLEDWENAAAAMLVAEQLAH